MLRFLPHLLTLANLIAGVLACYYALNEAPVVAAVLILLGAFFDFFDGMAARALGVSGELGKQLDSLADVVTFGVAPSLLAIEMLATTPNALQGGWASGEGVQMLPAAMAAFSALRLAKFNIDTRQSEQFIGLPTPANALFWISLPLIQWQVEAGYTWNIWSDMLGDLYMLLMHSPGFILAATAMLCILLVAELPLLALKFKSLQMAGNGWRYALVGASVLLLAAFGFMGIPIVLLLYILLSIISNTTGKHAV